VDHSTPGIAADVAATTMLNLVAKQHRIDVTRLEVTLAELVIFHDGAVWGRPGTGRLAWHLVISDRRGIREQLFVDADDGRLLEQIDLVERIQRVIYEDTTNNVVWQEGDPRPYSGSGPDRDVEINNLIDVAEQTYDTFRHLSGGTFLSWDGNDRTMRSYLNRPGMSCPNAYFNGSSTSFCPGTATDDVVAHEWVHGYTQETHGLVYAWQSGALNESYSDVFGEVVDLLYDSGTDFPSTVRAPDSCSAATGHDEPELIVVEPSSVAGSREVGSATFNPPPPWSVTATVEIADDGVGFANDACDPMVGFTPGNIALITMANCGDRFLTPVINAEAAGAVGAIVVNPSNDALIDMTGVGTLAIPAVFAGKTDGNAIRDALAGGTVTVTLRSSGDGSLRWLVSEDSAAFGGAIRDMWNPGCLNDPGQVLSSSYFCGDGDNGGVHTNSGVPNRAFALLVDGGELDGIQIDGIGLTRAAHIYWRAMSVYQFPLSDFRDHADLLATSCQDLIGAPLNDLLTGEISGETISPEHCAAVADAMTATQMRQWPTQCGFDTILDPDPPERSDPITVFEETFTSDPGTWTLSNEGVYGEYVPRDWRWTESVPDGGDGGAFYAINSPTIGNCRPGIDDQSGVMHLDSPVIELPIASRPVLVFDHYVATEERLDGGNLKISVNGGAFVPVPYEAFLFNPYNGALLPAQWNDNPMAGERVFAGTDETTYRGSWGQSQVDLSGLARGGDSIILRFDFGTDGCNGQDGWYVDNVRLSMTFNDRSGGRRVTPSP
jgi:hypothetical protein